MPPKAQEQIQGPAPAAAAAAEAPPTGVLREWKATDAGPGPQQGDVVWSDGRRWTVQYVNSKGLLDLRNAAGDVLYGVDTVLVEAEAPAAAPAAAAPAAAAAAPSDASAAAAPAEAPLLGALGEPCGAKGGSGAQVYRCHGGVAGEEECAVKLLNRSTARSDQVDALEAEARLCESLRHERLVRFLGVSCDALVPGVDGRCVAIVMELLPASLEQLVAARAAAARPFGLARLRGVALQLCEAVAHLHGLSPPLLHRDLKPANCFLPAGSLERDAADDDGGWVPSLRLGDFDMGRRTAEPVSEFVGTPSTMPPEMFAFEEHHTPADVWGAGMTLQWCLQLDDVFAAADMPQIEAAISADPPKLPLFTPPHAWPDALEPLAAVARRCCATDPAKRPPIGEVCDALRELAST